MSRRSNGLFVGKTRHLARHHKPSAVHVSDVIKDLKEGERVAIVPRGNFKNIPHPRYKGKIGKIIEKRGSSYVVRINVMNTVRTLIVPALHLQRV